jgi:hypothetical protein
MKKNNTNQVAKFLTNKFQFVVTILVLLIVIGCNNYPNSQEDALDLYIGKFWKSTEVELQEIYVNGELIQDERKQRFDSIIQKKSEGYAFFCSQKNEKGEIWEYSESFDEDINGNSYSIESPKLSLLNDKYVLIYPDGFVNYYRVSESSIDLNPFNSLNTKEHTSVIESITKEEMVTITKLSVVTESGSEIKVTIKYKLKSVMPQELNRYNEELGIWNANSN